MSVNYALSILGATVEVSEAHDESWMSPDALINGYRHTLGSSNPASIWAVEDDAVPQWIVIDFGQDRTINRVETFGQVDSLWNSSDPSLYDTFKDIGNEDFKIQYWNGSVWITIAEVEGNDRIRNRFDFPAVTTRKIRVYITKVAGNNNARMVAVEAWGVAEPKLLPLEVSKLNSKAGFNTTINSNQNSGYEQRIKHRNTHRDSFDAAYSIKSLSDLETLRNFFLACGGRYDSFLILDPVDFRTAKTSSSTAGDGEHIEFQIRKGYKDYLNNTYYKNIIHPIEGTVSVYVNDVLKMENTDYSVNYQNGVVRFNEAPADGANISFECEFYKKVRFDTDFLDNQLLAYWVNGGAENALVQPPSIPLVELLTVPPALTDVIPPDADALAFINAAEIEDVLIFNAVNTLVKTLKAQNLWAKLKAIYPFVGGTASTHKFNLKDPRDLEAAFRLTFNGGWTHSANGALPTGSSGCYADTHVNQSTDIGEDNEFLGFYSRTNSIGSMMEIGAQVMNAGQGSYISARNTNGDFSSRNQCSGPHAVSTPDSLGWYAVSRTTGTQFLRQKNASISTVSQASNTAPQNISFYLGAYNRVVSGAAGYSNREQAFAVLGNGLTQTEMEDLYTAVQAFQTALGRNIDADAISFLNAASIADPVISSAIDILVKTLKSEGLWTKLHAIYPFVGGTAGTHKFNLKDPQDTNGAFRLTFAGGWTHSATGALPNGSTGYADTFFNQLNNGLEDDEFIGVYLRTNTVGTMIDIGCISGNNGSAIWSRYGGNGFITRSQSVELFSNSNSDSRGWFAVSRTTAGGYRHQKNNTIADVTQASNRAPLNRTFYLGASHNTAGAGSFSDRQIAFAVIGKGLTQTEMEDLYTAIQVFQTALGRAV